MVALDGGPRPAAARLDLAALHGERDVVAAGVAGDELQLGAEDGVHRLREDVGIGARAGAADEDGARVEVLEARDSGLAPRRAHAHLVVRAAEPAEFRGLELRALGAEQRIERDAAADGAEYRAVLRRRLVQPVRKSQASRAFHVLRHDHRIAGKLLSHVASEEPGIDIVAAAHAVADVELDHLAFVELALRLGERRGDDADQETNGELHQPLLTRNDASMIIDFDSHLREGYFMDEVYRLEGPYERFRPVKMNDGRTHNTKFVHSLDPISPQGHAAHRHPYIYDPKTNWRGGEIAARQVGGYDMARRLDDIGREGIDKQLIFPTQITIATSNIPRLAHECARLFNDWVARLVKGRQDVFLPVAMAPAGCPETMEG